MTKPIRPAELRLNVNHSSSSSQAALCAKRIIHKVPDLIDHFSNRASSLINDRVHGVLLCGVTLVTDMCSLELSGAVESGVMDGFRNVSHSFKVSMLKSAHLLELESIGPPRGCPCPHYRLCHSLSDTSKRW